LRGGETGFGQQGHWQKFEKNWRIPQDEIVGSREVSRKTGDDRNHFSVKVQQWQGRKKNKANLFVGKNLDKGKRPPTEAALPRCG
jgi:hypothetical protein